MKSIILSVSCLLSAAAFAVELSDATNSQLVAELERRLSGGGGAGGAVGTYYCDGTSRLYLELTGETGQTEKKDFYVGDHEKCENYSKELSANRSRIRSVAIAAVCDSTARLYRHSLLPTGKFGNTTDVYIGDHDKCAAQAKAINTAK